ncbi:Cathepsin L-like proteinase [Seminavis robusta]|uniref:Cathepsin L-like proteinase n=1 Tax=Seminavis robusta TaxID=568900 RepID=A0A9N8HTG2_9STRA|nr:Cathepsin L-like proteinase [Seminavis robusta]|eukprot:Sro1583_g283960.1 Cathepsin L-like proteinase (629) ;mRNA; r:13250-15576
MKLSPVVLHALALFATNVAALAEINDELAANLKEERDAKEFIFNEVFNDRIWNAATKSKKVKEGEIPEPPFVDEPIDVPEQPLMPEKFSFTGLFTSAFASDAIYDSQPLWYSMAVDGFDGSITGDGTTLYFQLDDFICDANATESHSFMVGTFQTFDGQGDTPVPQEICWAAPPGFQINEGYPPRYKSLVSSWLIGDLFNITWQYGGITPSDAGPVHLWIRETLSEATNFGATAASTVLANTVKDGTIIYYQTRLSTEVAGISSVEEILFSGADATIKIDIYDFQRYSEDEDVPNAKLEPEVEETCSIMQAGYNTGQCAGNASSASFNAAVAAFVENVNARGTGYREDAESGYPSSYVPYEMVGDQDMVLSLDFFVPPMNNRSYMPVRNQGGCGSCYSFAAAEVISSSFAQANPGTTFVFSNQHVMDCLPLAAEPVSETEFIYVDSGLGCWGGDQKQVIDWLVATGSNMPLLTTVPYIGFSGTCNETVDMYHTGITGYSNLSSVEEMKNALYYHGDVSISLSVGFGWYSDFTSLVSWPFFLGQGISGEPEPANHAITVIGWGPCLVPLGDFENPCGIPGESPNVLGECWIVQNSWGTDWGYQGYLFVNTDPYCDTGVLYNDPIIPRRD